METIAEPTWITGSSEPLFGWLHRPADGSSRGAVVICPPLGRESLSSHRALRVLGECLASAGFLALLFDYRGTGDSAGGAARSGQVEAWVASVADAVAWVSEAVTGPVVLAGLRMGAVLAVEAMPRIGRLDALVLWDPCPSPSAFLREQHLLHRLATGRLGTSARDPAWLETPGMALSSDTVGDLKALEWSATTVAKLQGRLFDDASVLLLTRAAQPLSPLLFELSDHGFVESSEVSGQTELLEGSTSAGLICQATLDFITSFLSRRLPQAQSPCDISTTSSATVSESGDVVVLERAVLLGVHRLFGIVSERAGTGPPSPWVLLLTVAAHLHVGPSRQWVELARRWAAAGARVLRFDLSGVGDSGELDGPKAYTERSISDVIDAARAISPDAPARVILFGMCSGAWAASAAGTELAAQAVYLLNPDQWHAADPVVTDGSRPGSTAAASTLRGLLRRGVAVTLVVGPEDERSLDAALRQSERAELLEPAERPSVSQVRFRRIEALDHDLLTRAAGLAVDEQLSPLVLGDCGLSAVPSDS